MDYICEIFGEFDPRRDEDAALKFSLNLVLLEARFEDLGEILDDDSDVVGMSGDPGWSIERRDDRYSSDEDYIKWPSWAKFWIYVEPDSYHLSHPEFFMTRETFHEHVRAGLKAFVERHPDQESLVLSVRKSLSKFER